MENGKIVVITHLSDVLGKFTELVVVEGTRGKSELLGLFNHSINDSGTAMTLVDGTRKVRRSKLAGNQPVSRKEVIVLLAFGVLNHAAISRSKDHLNCEITVKKNRGNCLQGGDGSCELSGRARA